MIFKQKYLFLAIVSMSMGTNYDYIIRKLFESVFKR